MQISQNPHDWYLRAKAQRDELTERCKSLWARLREAHKQIASLKMEVELQKGEAARMRKIAERARRSDCGECTRYFACDYCKEISEALSE